MARSRPEDEVINRAEEKEARERRVGEQVGAHQGTRDSNSALGARPRRWELSYLSSGGRDHDGPAIDIRGVALRIDQGHGHLVLAARQVFEARFGDRCGVGTLEGQIAAAEELTRVSGDAQTAVLSAGRDDRADADLCRRLADAWRHLDVQPAVSRAPGCGAPKGCRGDKNECAAHRHETTSLTYSTFAHIRHSRCGAPAHVPCQASCEVWPRT